MDAWVPPLDITENERDFAFQARGGNPDVGNLNDAMDEWDELGNKTDENKIMLQTFVTSKTKVTRVITAAEKARSSTGYNPIKKLEKLTGKMLEYGGGYLLALKAKVTLDLSA